LGLRAADFSALFFEDCRIPRDNLLGDVGKGLQMIATCLDLCKIGASAHAVGIAQAALDASAEYANTRVQFGKTISKFQAIQWMIADMAMEIDAARLLVYKAAQLRDANEAYSVAAACAKLYASNTAKRATYNAVQIHGGIGYMREYPIERYYRDAKATEFYGGTGELQRINIAKSLINI
jgi:butyryl-CoA dehydrogenase